VILIETIIQRYQSKHFFLTHTVTENPYDVTTHLHDCYELFYFISGDLVYYIEGQAYKLYPNDLILTNSKELHRIMFNSKAVYERKFIHFTPEYISSFQTGEYNMLYYMDNRKLGYFNRIPAKDVLEHGIGELWESIEQALVDGTAASQIMSKAIFVQMLLTINKVFANYHEPLTDRHKHDHKIINILDYINKNLDEKITLDLLQTKFFVNKYYLCHLFKINTGFTVLEYITYKRIMKALELIVTGIPALDVAHAVGYGDYSTFYKAFKNITGYSPKHYYRQ
jgi:YesN/AraC family two-component response regulator